jgi:hypothetical protein
MFHRAVVACASEDRDSRRPNIVRLLIGGGVQTLNELFDAICRNDRGALEVLIPFGDMVIPPCWPSSEKWHNNVLNYQLLKFPRSLWKEFDQISIFLSELRDRLIESRNALRMKNVLRKGMLSKRSPIVSDGKTLFSSIGFDHFSLQHEIAQNITEKQRASLDPALTEILNNVDEAQSLAREGEHHRAIPLHEKVLAGLYKLDGDYDNEILTCLENLAISMRNVGNLTETKELQGLVLKGYLLRYGGYHPLTAGSLRNLGVTLSCEKKYWLAESCFRWAREVYKDTLGVKSSAAILCFNDLKSVENLESAPQGRRWPASL